MAREESITEIFNIEHSQSETERAGYIAIVGGGLMGRGIAQTAATVGINVLLIERDEETAEKCKQKLSETLDQEIERWALTKSEKRAIIARVKLSTELTDVAECDLVIEAIEEDFPSKKSDLQTA